MIDFFENRCGRFRSKSVLDFGFGKGTFMVAACRRFAKVIGVDFNLTTFTAIRDHFPDASKIQLFTDLKRVPEPVDVVFCWHTLEHLTSLPGVLSELRRAMKPGAWLFAQVPLFRPAYICKTHFMFLNRRSIEAGLTKAGYRVSEVMFDIENSFMTVLACR